METQLSKCFTPRALPLAAVALSICATAHGETSNGVISECLASMPEVLVERIPEGERHVVGAALSDGANPDYCELHSKITDGEQVVGYWQVGRLLALKELNYKSGLNRPEVVQKDFRTGEYREARVRGDTLVMFYKEGKRLDNWLNVNEDFPKPDAVEKAVKQKQVVDAGFDYFVRQNWAPLKSGSELNFYFASPVHETNIRLRARFSASKCSESSALCVVVEPANGLLRLFAGELVLSYSEDKKLMSFKGVTNIADADGKSKSREIIYQYFDK